MAGLVPAIHVLLAALLKGWMPGTWACESTPFFERLWPGMTKTCGGRIYPIGFWRSPKRDSVTTVPIRTNSSNSFEYSMTMASMVCSSVLIRVPAVRCARYPFGKQANVRHLTDDNDFVFQSVDAKA